MICLLKNLQCYSPEYIGKNDILVCKDKIFKIQPQINFDISFLDQIYDCDGLLAFPGLIDQHVHIIGGGGENGFQSRISEIDSSEIVNAGISTVVGLLGADSSTKSLRSLYAKAKGLEAQGLTTYIYSGSYTVPSITITDNIVDDMIFIDKVIGIKTAISDHRSSYPGIDQLIKMASDTHIGGMLSGKAGILHIHMGDGKNGLSPLVDLLNKSDLPIEQFVPTHVNRNQKLFHQAVKYCQSGGHIDLTSGENAGVSVANAIKILAEHTDLNHVTVSSDANASVPDGGVSRILTLYEDLISCIINKAINPETAFRLATENVAKVLKLFPAKGALLEGSDADILITDKSFKIIKLFCMGKLMTDHT